MRRAHGRRLFENSTLVEGHTLTYYVGRGTQSHGITALFRLVDSPGPIRVFEKLGVNNWRDLGEWEPVDVGDKTADGHVPIYFRRTNP